MMFLVAGRGAGPGQPSYEERDEACKPSTAAEQKQSLHVPCLVLFSHLLCLVFVGKNISVC